MKVITAKKASKKSIKNKVKKETEKRIDFKLDESMKIISAKEANKIANEAIEQSKRMEMQKRKEAAKKYKIILEEISKEIIEESKNGHTVLSVGKDEYLFAIENNEKFFKDLGYILEWHYTPKKSVRLHWTN